MCPGFPMEAALEGARVGRSEENTTMGQGPNTSSRLSPPEQETG